MRSGQDALVQILVNDQDRLTDGYDTPRALNAELFEERGCDDLRAADKGVGVEEGAADDADVDYRESAAEGLR